MYNRHPRKVIDHEICSQSVQVSTADEKEAVIRDLVELREQYKDKATDNIHKAQDHQKRYYDAKHDKYSHHVRFVIHGLRHVIILNLCRNML